MRGQHHHHQRKRKRQRSTKKKKKEKEIEDTPKVVEVDQKVNGESKTEVQKEVENTKKDISPKVKKAKDTMDSTKEENTEETTPKHNKKQKHKPVMVELTFQVESSLRLSFEQVLSEKGENMQEQLVKFMKEYITSK